MAIFKKKLSKRAQKLLNEIRAEEISSQDNSNKSSGIAAENRLAVRYLG